MNKILSIGSVAAVLAMGVANANATTNWVASVTLSLNAYVQGPTVTTSSTETSTIIPRHLATKDIIGKLKPGASTAAKLILKADVNSNSGPTFFVRDNGVDTDVSAKVQASVSDTTVTALTQMLATGKKTSMEKFILTLTFNDQNGASFTVSGLATLRQSTLIDRTLGNLGQVPAGVTAQVAGTGDDTEDGLPADTSFLVNGTATVTAGKIETN
jgi:hypothetical protein